MNPHDFDAVIFDLDGTLANTMPAHFEAWHRTLKQIGLDHLFPEDRFYSMGGIPAHKIFKTLADEAGITLDVERLSHEKEALFIEVVGEVEAIDSVFAIARELRGVKPIAIATGSMRIPAEKILNCLGALDWFETLVCAEDIEHPKPAPDIYLEAAKQLGVDPTRCLAYEDTDVGMQAAKSAGMACVDVRPMYPESLQR